MDLSEGLGAMMTPDSSEQSFGIVGSSTASVENEGAEAREDSTASTSMSGGGEGFSSLEHEVSSVISSNFVSSSAPTALVHCNEQEAESRMGIPEPPALPSPTPPPQLQPAAVPIQIQPSATGTGLQIVTRKRSSMSQAANSSSISSSGFPAPTSGCNVVQSGGVAPLQDKKSTEHPPKKKKKYTPKPKKSPPEGNNNAGAGLAGTSSSKSKSKKSSSSKSKSKKPPVNSTTAKPITPMTIANPPSKPSKSKSKRGQGQNQQHSSISHPIPNFGMCVGGRASLPPLQPMPKLMRMTGVGQPPHPFELPIPLSCIKEEPQDWDECNADGTDEMGSVLEEKSSGSGISASNSGRKKKSKGRNGNIYIGVFNRIEWMKLQEAFGFTTVNNFGTFVLETMRRVHGDIQFWCDLATASGVYPDLTKYEWNNGFPHAINHEGKRFIPESDPNLSDEKRQEVTEMGMEMWQQRLNKLKLQQQLQMGDAAGDVVLEEVEVDEDDEEAEAISGLENYLGNMEKLGCGGEYSPPPIELDLGGGIALDHRTMTKLTEEQINSVWNEQLTNAKSLERFGNIFDFINSIDQEGHALVMKQLEEKNAPMPRVLEEEEDEEDDGMVKLEAAAML